MNSRLSARNGFIEFIHSSLSPKSTALLKFWMTFAISVRFLRVILFGRVEMMPLPSGVTIIGLMNRRKKKPPTIEKILVPATQERQKQTIQTTTKSNLKPSCPQSRGIPEIHWLGRIFFEPFYQAADKPIELRTT